MAGAPTIGQLIVSQIGFIFLACVLVFVAFKIFH